MFRSLRLSFSKALLSLFVLNTSRVGGVCGNQALFSTIIVFNVVSLLCAFICATMSFTVVVAILTALKPKLGSA